jgi:predicted aspartyl protease
MHITEIPIQLIIIEGDGFHLMLNGFINNIPARFLIDTGASRSVFDQENIKQFATGVSFEDNEKLSTGLGTNEMPSQVLILESLQFGELLIADYQAVAIDLRHVHLSYQNLGLPQIDGVLGGDLLKQYKAVINYKTNKIKFYY